MRLITKEILFVLGMIILTCVLLKAAPHLDYPDRVMPYMLACFATFAAIRVIAVRS
jgi:hypothetical protein